MAVIPLAIEQVFIRIVDQEPKRVIGVNMLRVELGELPRCVPERLDGAAVFVEGDGEGVDFVVGFHLREGVKEGQEGCERERRKGKDARR